MWGGIKMILDPNVEKSDDFLILYYDNDDDGVLKCCKYSQMRDYFTEQLNQTSNLFFSNSQRGMSVFKKCFDNIDCENGQLTFSYLINGPVYASENDVYEDISAYLLSYKFNTIDDYYSYLISKLNSKKITEDEFDVYLEWVKAQYTK